MQIEVITKALEEVTNYLKPFLALANCHMVSFITQNVWKCYVPQDIRNEVDCKTTEQMLQIFWQVGKEKFLDLSKEGKRLKTDSPFADFLYMSYEKSLPCSGLAICVEDYLNTYCCTNQSTFRLDQFMSPKKMHEVEVMSKVVALLSQAANVTHIVDIGSGKGYLSSVLALYYKLNVLGLDSSQVNTHGAQARTEKLEVSTCSSEY